MKNLLKFSFFVFFPILCCYGQSTFTLNPGVESDKIRFELVNNLIIIPVELNGLKLSFLLDTGVNSTVLIGLNSSDSLELPQGEIVRLQGIGSDEYIEAIKSENNQMRVGEAFSDDLSILLILDRKVNFSPRLGFPVHGILGYDFFKSFVVEINYQREFIRVHSPENEPQRVKKYQAVPLVFHRNKPYVNTVITVDDTPIRSTLLLDSGLADALWLFQGEEIQVPERHFEDFIGLGLLGDIYGKRSKSSLMSFSEFNLENVVTSFPDTTAFSGLKSFTERNGSIGGEILRRFHLIFNYDQKKLYLKPNSNFEDDYFLNMAGITVEHDGFVLVRSSARAPSFSGILVNSGSDLVSETSVASQTISLKPEFRIARLRADSPAAKAGLMIGDILESINSTSAYRLDIEKIAKIFASKEGKRIRMKVKRNGQSLSFSFQLERPL